MGSGGVRFEVGKFDGKQSYQSLAAANAGRVGAVWKVLVRDRPESIWRIGKNSKTLPSHSHVSLGSNLARGVWRNDGEGEFEGEQDKRSRCSSGAKVTSD